MLCVAEVLKVKSVSSFGMDPSLCIRYSLCLFLCLSLSVSLLKSERPMQGMQHGHS